MAFFGASYTFSSLLLLLLLLTSSSTSHAQGARGDDDSCSNWNETAVELEAQNKTLQSALQQHSSCYNFEYTYIIYSPDPPPTVQVQVRNGIAVNFDPTRDFNSILDVMNFIFAQCVEGCVEAAAAAEAENDSNTATSTTRAYDETPLEPAHQCQVEYDDATGVPTSLWVDRFSFLADEEYTYSIDNFEWVDCERESEAEETTDASPEVEETTDTPPEVEETTDSPPEVEEPATCIDYEQVEADLEAAQEAWPDHQCYQFTYTQGEESVLVQVKDGVVISSDSLSGDVKAQTMNELMDDLNQLCVANCPESGAEKCSATFATEGYILTASIKPSETAVDEVSYEVTDFEVMDCNDPAFAEGTSSAPSLALYLALAMPVALIKLLM